MDFQEAVDLLKKKYSNEDWYICVGIPYQEKKIILYVRFQPENITFPATWKGYSLYIAKTAKKKPNYII